MPTSASVSREGFLAAFWRLAGPYWSSEDRWAARGLLATVIALNLALVALEVRFNTWNNDFYNALQDMDQAAFTRQLLIFALLAAGFIAIAVYQLYLNQMLQIRWRRWLTDRYLAAWLGEQRFYRLQIGREGVDNPDQRIEDDIKLFVRLTLALGLGLMSAVVTLVSFVIILWTLSGVLTVPLPGGGSVDVHGYMVWAALAYALVGTWATMKVGSPLVALNFHQQRLEADFRFSMVRLRENAEPVALWQGEEAERVSLRGTFAQVVDNYRAIMLRQKKLTWLTASYTQVAILFPFVVAAPRYFAREIQLGGMMQVASAFGQVQSSLSFIINSFATIAEWKSVVDRLTGFTRAMETVDETARRSGIHRREQGDDVSVEGLAIDVPGGRRLFEGLTLSFPPGRALLITGPTGSGKSSLMRVIAGIWPHGSGEVRVPKGKSLLFLSQRPYLPIGTLRDALLFPGGIEADDTALEGVLAKCGLPHLKGQLDRNENWGLFLSGGEQQRLGIARVLLHRPDFLFLDEATSALDEPSEAALYRHLREALPRSAIVSIGHRSTLKALHDEEIALGDHAVLNAPA
jgi:putative ATP-binding cassette transporter